MTTKDARHAKSAKFHLTLIEQHLKRGPLSDELVLDAVCQRLASALEEISHLDPLLIEGQFGGEWAKIKGTRNLIAHSYRNVDHATIQKTVERDLPTFVAHVDALVLQP